MTDKQEETEIKVKMEMKNTGDLLVGVDLATTPVPSKGDCPGGGGEREIRKGVLPGETVGSAPTTRATNFGGAIRIRGRYVCGETIHHCLSQVSCHRWPVGHQPGNYIRVRKAHVPGSQVNEQGSVRATINGGDKVTVTAATPLQSKGIDKLFSSGGGKIQVKAVVTIRKKIKEKIEDQWEFLINGIGHGILIQLVNEQVDPNCDL
ncbi:hypothetical protein ACFX19_034842 [Malus domestica]